MVLRYVWNAPLTTGSNRAGRRLRRSGQDGSEWFALADYARVILQSRGTRTRLCCSLALRPRELVSCLVEAKGVSMSLGRVELPQGTLDLLILKAVALEPQHGWAISERLHQISSATLQIRQGSLYPALHRLERRGRIKARWGITDNNRRAKYYELTRKGRARLDAETDAWRKLSAAIGQVLEAN